VAQPERKKTGILPGLEVLIVEDSSDTLTLLKALFTREGARVVTATSAAEALNRVISRRPDLIISDIGMPEIDGYQFLEQLRAIPEMSDLPAIAISGYASDSDRDRAIEVGYLTLISKPIDTDALFNAIRELDLTAVSGKTAG
jgi:CheY-like chemotaxis protein